jgi:hypothetical protein
VAGRVPVVALLETAGALATAGRLGGTPGLAEVFVGLNDLHLSLDCSFMFEPLAMGHRGYASLAWPRQGHGRRFGFGGIARLDEGLLPGRDVLAEHVRLGSHAVILSRTFHRQRRSARPFEAEIAALRHAERALSLRSHAQRRQTGTGAHGACQAIGAAIFHVRRPQLEARLDIAGVAGGPVHPEPRAHCGGRWLYCAGQRPTGAVPPDPGGPAWAEFGMLKFRSMVVDAAHRPWYSRRQRPPHHPGGPFHPPHQPGRAAAVSSTCCAAT